MKCHYCDIDYPMTKIMFTEDGMVPGIPMTRYRAKCVECRQKVAIDDTSKNPTEPPKDYEEDFPF